MLAADLQGSFKLFANENIYCDCFVVYFVCTLLAVGYCLVLPLSNYLVVAVAISHSGFYSGGRIQTYPGDIPFAF